MNDEEHGSVEVDSSVVDSYEIIDDSLCNMDEALRTTASLASAVVSQDLLRQIENEMKHLNVTQIPDVVVTDTSQQSGSSEESSCAISSDIASEGSNTKPESNDSVDVLQEQTPEDDSNAGCDMEDLSKSGSLQDNEEDSEDPGDSVDGPGNISASDDIVCDRISIDGDTADPEQTDSGSSDGPSDGSASGSSSSNIDTTPDNKDYNLLSKPPLSQGLPSVESESDIARSEVQWIEEQIAREIKAVKGKDKISYMVPQLVQYCILD